MLPTGSYPTPSSAEYRRSYSLDQMKAASAFVYANGAGVTVAMIDDGVNGAVSELAGRVSGDSIDLYPSRNQAGGDPPASGAAPNHGTLVAEVMAANYNGAGTVGVAYKATVLGIRADQAGCTSSGCFFDNDLTTGVDYAISHGARVINLSLGGPTSDGPQFEAALRRAVNAGLVVTVSAGNGGRVNPDYPARYAADPRYTGAVIAVGATDSSGSIASFSNQAGATADNYLVAPGDSVVSACEPSASCWLLSGTSFSAPQVAGALALLLQAFPSLTGRQAVDILLRTATDLGAAGADPVYGRGLLNLAAAFSPAGALSVQSAGGAVQIAASALAAGIGSAAFGDALASAPLATVGYDEYRRAFRVDLGRSFPAGRPTALAPLPGPAIASTASRFGLAGGSLSLAASAPRFEGFTPPPRPGLQLQGPAHAAQVTAQLGRVSLTHWSGVDAPAPAISGPRDPFQRLAAPDSIDSGAVALGGWSLAVERGQARRQGLYDPAPRPGAAYSTLSLRRRGDGLDMALAVGRLGEPAGALGADLRGDSPYLMAGRTQFASLFASGRLVSGLSLSLEASAGLSRGEGQLLSLVAGRTSSWRISLDGACAPSICSRFSLYATQPLRLASGRFRAILPAAPISPSDSPALTVRDFTAAPSGRELDIGAELERNSGRFGTGGLAAALALQPGSRRDAAPAFGLSAYWRSQF